LREIFEGRTLKVGLSADRESFIENTKKNRVWQAWSNSLKALSWRKFKEGTILEKKLLLR
jgi:hypothetical protein